MPAFGMSAGRRWVEWDWVAFAANTRLRNSPRRAYGARGGGERGYIIRDRHIGLKLDSLRIIVNS
jgi:hypothetical protein